MDILVASDTHPAITWDRVCLATTADPDMNHLTKIIPDKEKWQKHHLPHQIQAYYAVRHHLSTTDGVVLYKDRILHLLVRHHECHCHNCSHCKYMALSKPNAPQKPPTLSVYPFKCVCAEYFYYKGINYLVIVDRYSNWCIMERAQDGSHGLINCLCR